MISTRVVLQAALNGDRTKAAHSATPVSVEELAQDAAACVAAGARAIHLHPRDPEGRETLEAVLVDEVVTKVRAACGVPVGVTTSAEIEPDPERRLGLVRAWRAPDYASVNLSEAGATKVMKALVEAGVGIEAGVWTAEDAERLAASGLSGHVTRILVEPVELQLQDSEDKTAYALGLVEDIHRALDRLGLKSPRLQHGDGEVTWVLAHGRGPEGPRHRHWPRGHAARAERRACCGQRDARPRRPRVGCGHGLAGFVCHTSEHTTQGRTPLLVPPEYALGDVSRRFSITLHSVWGRVVSESPTSAAS
jgi:hypothetical protein